MKKMLILAALAFSAFATQAQTLSVPATDTVGASETSYLNVPLKYFNGADANWTASITSTKISGTAGASVFLEVKVDTSAANFVPVRSRYGNYADSFLVTDKAGPQVWTWFVNGRVVSARLRVTTPSGTQATQIKGFFIKK